jgi:exodeoxyribonuclease V alpha subunit
MMEDAIRVVEFNMIPINERYYSEDTSWGIFSFTTKDELPHYSDYFDPFMDNKTPQKMSNIVGKMQKLYLGSEYKVRATCEYNSKYSSYQYTPVSPIVAVEPKTFESQELFLKSLTNETVAKNILHEYPNVIEEVMNGELKDLEYEKIKGLGKRTWDRLRNSIIDNYVISDIITMLQPLGVTFNMIKKLLSEEPNPALLKQQLNENPYIMTKIRGLGFKRVDDLSLKLKPDLRNSMFRLVAFVQHYLYEIGENDGHTWVTKETLEAKVSDNVSECMGFLTQLLDNNSFLYQEDGKIGLLYYRNIEEKIYEILVEKNNMFNEKFVFTEEEVEEGIKQCEEEQGFQYTEEQTKTIKASLGKDVAVISGKAGTGKTSISKAIFRIYKNKNFSIIAMALSAKAAQRITEATNYSASTIHRALGAKGFNDFTYNHNFPLPVDLVFVDEASMINAKLFYDLLCAINYNTRIIISGDHMQLPPIGFGNIFSDMLLRDDVLNSNQLTKPMRQAQMSGILSDANLIRDGINPIDTPELKIIHGELQDMYYMFRESREGMQNIAINTYLKSIENDGIDEVVIAIPRKKDCVNSAFEINKIIQEKLLSGKQSIDKSYIKYRLGAKVMQIVNDYEKNVFNGEVGYITNIYKDEKNREFCDITYKSNDTEKVITYSKTELDNVDLAYAMTVHKLQGSGYKTVIGIVDNTHYSLLDNCMLYTMITRAKKRCCLLAEPSAFIKCIKTNHNSARQTWLKEIK